ncbi:hypothetical protein [Cellvibrio fibrivorans]|uniref:Small neutral amino acid transporter SnatA (MarC family) n=1 Tax=Cellvibrio fibrivorans TaxID=126350 RepID=A0ABU1UYR7_9GAMM|nr:hypothetical protein [Cellvibrio fibrivorans]MDR7090345.1 small neutral amino acid transporter SnatA (MarC family) [Cellvibrio fibrivorans]
MSSLQLGMLVAILLVWLLTIIDIARSSRVDKDEKLIWIFTCLALSWFCWILFYALAPLKKRFS